MQTPVEGPRTPGRFSNGDAAHGARPEAPGDAARKLKGYLQELDKREEEIMQGLPANGARLVSEAAAATQDLRKDLVPLTQDDAPLRRALQEAAANAADYEERLAIAEERLKAEGRMWELREQDLQEQFAYREAQLKRRLEQRVRALEEQVRDLGGEHPDGGSARRAAVDCPVSLGVSVAEERAERPFAEDSAELHPGVRVTAVDASVANCSLEVGDTITKVSYTVPIGSSKDFRRAVGRMSPGDLVMVHVAKDGGERVYPIIAGGSPGAGPDATV